MHKLNKSLIQSQSYNTAQNLSAPTEAIFALPEKVIQFGTGVLLRGLIDYYIDKANRQGIFNGRVVVVKSTDGGGADAFTEQDGLFTQAIRGIENGQNIEQFVVNSSISRVLSAKSEWQAILACALSPEIQVVVSNTTEVGIQLTEEEITLTPPSSFPGKLTAFLYERYKAFKGSPESGLVIVPTELIVDNGKKLKQIVLQLAAFNKLENGFIDWLESANTFCNSLVDRIVTGKPDAAASQAIYELLGYNDDLLIASEVYGLWAIEGGEKVKQVLSFAQADQGVVIAPDITAFRERKLRLLNGTHTISVALGYLCGHETVGECMNDKLMGKFFHDVAVCDIAPAVDVDYQSAKTFAEAVLERFRNPYIVHPLINICLQYTSKMKMRNVQSLLNYYKKLDSLPAQFTLGFAAYLLFTKPVKEENGKYFGDRNGVLYPINDESAAYFYQAWQNVDVNNTESLRAFVQKVLSNTSLWDTDLSALRGLTDTLTTYLSSLINKGAKATLEELLG